MECKIRRLSITDNESFQSMDTGIADDYVKHIFPRIVDSDILYGAFDRNEMVAIAGYTIFADRYAVLGRLRTDIRYRGRGLATKLMKQAQEKALQHPKIHWVGLATQEDNPAVHKVASHLEMNHIASLYSCVLNEKGMKVLKDVNKGQAEEWVEVKDNKRKRGLFQELEPDENHLNLFPYACYYPLPYDMEVLDDEYLSHCKVWQRGNRFVSAMPDQKGEAYFHIKYFWDDSFEQVGLWAKLTHEAQKEGKKIWIDLSPSGFKNIPNVNYFDLSSPWYLFGTEKK